MNSKLIIAFLFVFSLVLRAVSALHGSPFCYHSDEHWLFQPAFRMVTDGHWDIEWFRVPPLLILLYRILLSCLQMVAPMNLVIPEATWFDSQSILPSQFPALYAGRLLVSAFGSASVVLMYLILQKFIQWKKAFFFALFYSLLSVNIFYSSYLRPEPLVIFFLTLSVYFLCNYQFCEKKYWTWLAGASFGLACSSKYNASFFLLSTMLFLWFCKKDRKDFIKLCSIYFVSSVIAFIATIPHMFWKLSTVTKDIAANYTTYKGGQAGNMGSHFENFVYYLDNLYSFEKFGILFWIFILTLITLPLFWKKISKTRQPLLATSIFFCISYVFFLCQFNYRAERNLIFIFPFLTITVAIFVAHFSEVTNKLFRSAVLAASIVGILSGTYNTLTYFKKCNKALPQDNVRNWIDQNAPAGAIIIREFESPLLNPQKYGVLYSFATALIKPKALIDINPNYLIVTNFVRKLRNDYKNDYPKKFTDWLWSKEPEFEDLNPESTLLGVHFRIYDFQKYKADFLKEFDQDLKAPDQTKTN
jgi:4-amino-4-deoxy-L-arabinose transferase-like glycosyltransferase